METESAIGAGASGRGDAWREKARQQHQKGIEWQTWRVAVSNPATPAGELEIIAEAVVPKKGRATTSGSGICVLEAIAAHPNTPPRLLARIVDNAPTCAHAFCANPLAPFLLLEQPDFLLQLSHDGKLALLRDAAIPPAFLFLLANMAKQEHAFQEARAEEIRRVARFHVAFAGKKTTDWETEVREYWKGVCARADRREREWHTDLVEMGLAPSWAAQNPAPLPTQPARYPFLEEWFRFAHLAGSPFETEVMNQIGPDVKDKRQLARSLGPHATPGDLIQLVQTARSNRGLVMQAVSRHPNADAAVIEALASAKFRVPFSDLAQHEQTPAHLLTDLLQNDDPAVRRLARKHKNAPPDAVEISRRVVMLQTRSDEKLFSLPFVSFVASLHFGGLRSPNAVVMKAEALQWTGRLEAVLIAAQNPDALKNDFASRTTDDLLRHLARDGNRLVRAAAQTCLASSAYRFIL